MPPASAVSSVRDWPFVLLSAAFSPAPKSSIWPSVIRLRTQTPSLARRKPLSGLGSLLRVRGLRAAPTVTPLLSLFVWNIQPVALAPTGVNVSKLIYR